MADLKVHPAAAVFPMLADDELAELAESIRANGLRHPIALDTDGRIVDGRNRDAACLMAGVEPTFITLPTETDILAYILDENDRRRHMSKGQRAMAIAMMIETDEGRRDGTAKRLSVESTVSDVRVSHAVTIRRHAPDLAPGVLAGTEAFDRAYETAKARKRERDDHADAKAREARSDALELERIRRFAPDLAALVPDSLTVAEAAVTLAQRQQRETEAKRATTTLVAQTLDLLDSYAMTASELALTIVRRLDPTVIASRPDCSLARVRRCMTTLHEIAELIAREDTHGRA